MSRMTSGLNDRGFTLLELIISMVVVSIALTGVLMVITGCLTMDEAYQAIEWQAVFLVAGTLPLGIAMEKTGTAQFLADMMINSVGGLGPMALLAGFYILPFVHQNFPVMGIST